MIQPAYYSSTISEFLDRSSQAVLGFLAENHSHDLTPAQRNAWLGQIECLQHQLAGIDGWIALEFVIPRIGKRVDAIITHAGVIYVIEFKVGSQEYAASAADQVVDYALDLKNFHAGS